MKMVNKESENEFLSTLNKEISKMFEKLDCGKFGYLPEGISYLMSEAAWNVLKGVYETNQYFE